MTDADTYESEGYRPLEELDTLILFAVLGVGAVALSWFLHGASRPITSVLDAVAAGASLGLVLGGSVLFAYIGVAAIEAITDD